MATQEGIPRERGLYDTVTLSICLFCFVLHYLGWLSTWWLLSKTSSALIYDADHIFHKLKMTTSRHVLMNKSHRFWIFSLKQKQKQTSPNYILSCILNSFKCMLTSQKSDSPPFLVPVCSILPTVNPLQPYRCRLRLTKKSLWGCWKGRASPVPTTEQRVGGGLSPEPHPSLGWVPTSSELSKPPVGKAWMGPQQETWMLSVCHHASAFCLRWAHSPSLPWSWHKRESARRNHLNSKAATHLILKFREFIKHMASFA